ncbi:uncharacterized protein LOC129743999 [Uranotaenia lowii]|uniref:uncharacterized protein LOC129743999 n=1 Tax=Uranotaenia lowii TaxID=190385 RepID=UPI002479142D|nr:uncharacterized protein LOC129743999 [Uranotaenia lowii]
MPFKKHLLRFGNRQSAAAIRKTDTSDVPTATSWRRKVTLGEALLIFGSSSYANVRVDTGTDTVGVSEMRPAPSGGAKQQEIQTFSRKGLGTRRSREIPAPFNHSHTRCLLMDLSS